jgi:hypothetical protein
MISLTLITIRLPLIRIARWVLSICANSASCERLFSFFGATLTKLRNCRGTGVMTSIEYSTDSLDLLVNPNPGHMLPLMRRPQSATDVQPGLLLISQP